MYTERLHFACIVQEEYLLSAGLDVHDCPSDRRRVCGIDTTKLPPEAEHKTGSGLRGRQIFFVLHCPASLHDTLRRGNAFAVFVPCFYFTILSSLTPIQFFNFCFWDGPPTLHKALSRHAILITPVDQHRCTYRFLPCPASAFPEYRAGRRPLLYFRGLLKVHSRYGLPVCSQP